MYREVRGLHEAAYILALFALGSQLLALVRDRLIAHQFGAGETLDIYYAAFRVPDLLFALFASVLSVYVLVPFVADRLTDSVERARELISAVFAWFLVGYAGMALVVFVCAPLIAAKLFPGFSAAEQELLVVLLRILLAQPFFLAFSSLLGVATQIHRKFVLYATSPLLYNIGIILGVVAFYPVFGVAGLALGVVVGAAAHLLVQVPFALHSGLFPRLTFGTDRAALAAIVRASLPRATTLALHQVVFLALSGLATLMAAGSVAVLQFAYNLQSVPLTIIGVSYSVAAFPTLARLFSEGERSAYLAQVAAALRAIIFWAIPALAIIIIIRAQLVRVILGTGAFDWDDTRLVAAALALFTISLAAQAVHLLVVRAFYAGGDTRTPLAVTLVSSAGIVVLAGLLTGIYDRVPALAETLGSFVRADQFVGVEVLLLPLAFSVVLLLHAAVLVWLFCRRFGGGAVAGLGGTFLRALGAGIVAAAAAYTTLNLLVAGLRMETFLGIFLQGFAAGTAGIAAGVLFLVSAASPELREVAAALGRRVLRTRPIAPQDGA